MVFQATDSEGYFISNEDIKGQADIHRIMEVGVGYTLMQTIEKYGTQAVKCPQCDFIQAKAPEPAGKGT